MGISSDLTVFHAALTTATHETNLMIFSFSLYIKRKRNTYDFPKVDWKISKKILSRHFISVSVDFGNDETRSCQRFGHLIRIDCGCLRSNSWFCI